MRLWIEYRDLNLINEFSTEPPDGLAPEIMYPQIGKGEIWCVPYEQALMEKLRTGELAATGLKNGRGTRQSVPVVEWQDLQFRDVGGPRAVLIDRQQFGGNMWTKLSFPDAEVQSLWGISKSSVKNKAEKQAELWLARLLVNEDEVLTTRPKVKALAQEKFGVSSRAFDRALAAAKKSTCRIGWPKVGRPREKCHTKN